MGWWEVDSKGNQSFEINLQNVTQSLQVTLETVEDEEDWDFLKCDELGNVLISRIGMPLTYDSVSFDFKVKIASHSLKKQRKRDFRFLAGNRGLCQLRGERSGHLLPAEPGNDRGLGDQEKVEGRVTGSDVLKQLYS